MLADHGYDGFTMDEIANRAGVAKQSLYRIWGSKTELVADVVLQGSYSVRVGAVPDTGELRRDLTLWLASVGRYLDRPGVRSVVRALSAASASTQDPERVSAFDRTVTEPVGRLVAERLERAKQAGEVGAALPIAAAVDLLIGYLTLVSVGHERLRPDRVHDIISILTGHTEQPD